MIRLALILALFAGLTLASIAQADPSPSPAPAAQEETRPAVEASEDVERVEKAPARPRWSPRQARRRGEYGPALTPYPVLLAPTGIPNLHF